jgi:hypothetical protein
MSEENVEIVRRYIEGSPRDPTHLSGFVARYWEPDGDYYPVRRFPEARPCHGRDEIVNFLGEFFAAWENYSYSVKGVKAVGDDRVFLHGRIRAEGRASGLGLEGDLYQCFWLRHGRFFRAEDHLTMKGAGRALGLTGEALEAAGLWE